MPLNDSNDEINIDNINLNNESDNIHEIDNNMFNRTLIVGPSFCGKTHLLLNNLHLFHLDNPRKTNKNNN